MKKQATFTGGDGDCRRGEASVTGNFPAALMQYGEIVLEQCLPISYNA